MTDVASIEGVALSVIPALIRPQRKIGSIQAHVTLAEDHVDELVITEHPVENGAPITDHAYKRPARLTLKVAWSNSYQQPVLAALGALGGVASEVISTGAAAFNTFQQLTGSSYVSEAYRALLKMQGERQLIEVITGKRRYKNLLIASVSVTTDAATEEALFATVTCQEVFLVQTQTATLPPSQNMADPSKTAGLVDAGAQQLKPAPQVNAAALAGVLGQ